MVDATLLDDSRSDQVDYPSDWTEKFGWNIRAKCTCWQSCRNCGRASPPKVD